MSRNPSNDVSSARNDPSLPREGLALAVLTFGLVPGAVGLFVGWSRDAGSEPSIVGVALGVVALVIGLWLVCTSVRWTTRQKALAAVCVPIQFGAGLVVVAHTVTHFSMEDNDASKATPAVVALVWVGFFLLFIVPAAAAAYLSRTARVGGQSPHSAH